MRKIQNNMRAEAARVASGFEYARVGIVTSYDPDKYAIKATIMPEEIETGWIKLQALQVGDHCGIYAAPNIGDQVKISHLEGDRESGIGDGFLNDDSEDVPPHVPAGEIHIIHKAGAYLKLTTDGKVSINSNVEIDAGNVGEALKKVVTDAFVTFFNNHTHGSGHKPDQMMGDAQLTTVLKAN